MRSLRFALLALVLAGCQKKEEAPAAETPTKTAAAVPDGPQTLDLTVTEKGFEPSPIRVKATLAEKFPV